jgi:hypothetical protein
MTNDLMKMSKLVHNDDFILRVAAAMFMFAKDEALSKQATNSREFAIWVLKNPMVIENSLLTLIASDKAVLNAVTVPETGIINLSALNDEILLKSLKDNWNIAAVKFPVMQQAKSDTTQPVVDTPPPVGKFVGKNLPGNPFIPHNDLPAPTTNIKS